MTSELFEREDLEPPEPPPAERAQTAADIKDALRRRHPGETNGSMTGQWTCIEEWLGIDLLALNSWADADVIGYEVKVSRGDLRRELLNPTKRAPAIERTTEFYFAMPANMLSQEELAFQEPAWAPVDFERPRCKCGRPGRLRHAFEDCDPPGTRKSRVEQEGPVVWVPADVGLVVVDGQGCRVVKRSPKRKDPVSIFKPPFLLGRDYGTDWAIRRERQSLNDLVRWVSHRPDPRHVLAR